MNRTLHLLTLVALPVALIGALVLLARGAGVIGPGAGYVMRVDLPRGEDAIDLPQVTGGEDLPLVVIDPGHGGHDPGASARGYVEKRLVMGLAEALRDELEQQGIARVALTREDDTYLLHNERYRIAQRLGADLFLSIHADSAGTADEVTGASIYTLSKEASSRAAALFAAKENASDIIGGVDLSREDKVVSDILVDLSQRRTQERSVRFAELIEREGQDYLQFHPQARRSAWLAVLRAPDIPSVLFESGFISNETDAQRLASDEGREAFAEAMSKAIAVYLLRETTNRDDRGDS
ncbi:N-acetylmuramoyl-L-alanine amidase [Erythrobacter sp. SD-21]|uniref:N-acetylmuramoyl-L-alanine amidase family protein n=1 Tax=Erythrobacter sp. SD-21 TaxID=161528 RepID=UPI000153F04B|nr:N-acetylmuramoyl-L-alanine amidase [Erythrobacter sp. SD-21]EDL50407.1 N-acetylmuramoyl-L-alanine amidase [Erythrobacter sp. SD-21]